MKRLLVILLVPGVVGCASHKKKSKREWNETERIETTETFTVPSLTATLKRPPVVIDGDTIRWSDPETGVEAKQYKDADTGEEKLDVKIPERSGTKNSVSEIQREGSESSKEVDKWIFQWWWFVILGIVIIAIIIIKKFIFR